MELKSSINSEDIGYRVNPSSLLDKEVTIAYFNKLHFTVKITLQNHLTPTGKLWRNGGRLLGMSARCVAGNYGGRIRIIVEKA